MSDIINVTSKAAAHIKTIMQRNKHAVGFSLSVKNTCCSGYMYNPKIVEVTPLDYICITVDNDLTVFIDPDCIHLIKGLTIDFVEKSSGVKQLSYDNPNVDTTCGCGESFSLKEEASDVDA